MSSVMGCRRYGEGVLTIDAAGGGCGEMVIVIIDEWCWPPHHGGGCVCTHLGFGKFLECCDYKLDYKSQHSKNFQVQVPLNAPTPQCHCQPQQHNHR